MPMPFDTSVLRDFDSYAVDSENQPHLDDIIAENACEFSAESGESDSDFFSSDDSLDFSADVDFDAELDLADDGKKLKGKRARRNAAVVLELPEGATSIYACLVAHGLLKKITDIVLAKVAVPWHLRPDASQEIHTAWAVLMANQSFERNQVARYAYMSGQHAALKLRRSLGAVVTIPGAIFRTGRNSAFMESIGAAINPKDVDDFRDSIELSVEENDDYAGATVSLELLEKRLTNILLTGRQRYVVERILIARVSADTVAAELSVPIMYVERLLNQITQKLNDKDQRPNNFLELEKKVSKTKEKKNAQKMFTSRNSKVSILRQRKRSKKEVSCEIKIN